MVQGIDLFFALFNNLAIFIALVTVYRYLLVQFKQTTRLKREFILGLSFGAFAIGCMYAKIPVFKGVIVDQRNAIVALSGAFGGPLPAFISALMTGAFRMHLGGEGAIGGTIGVGLAALAGIGLHVFRQRFSSIVHYAAGVVIATAIIMPGFLFLGDLRVGWQLMMDMSLPYGSAIFLGIFLGGLLMNREEARYQIELSFRASEKRYRALVEGTQDLITYTDSDGKLTFVNHVAGRIWGYAPPECLGRSAFDFIHPDDRPRTITWFEQCLAAKIQQAAIENRQVNAKTGQSHFILWSSSFHYNDSGELVGVGSIARDITEHKEAEALLRASEARYRSLFEYVPDGILITDQQGRILDANPMMCRMLGHDLGELTALHSSEIVSPSETPNLEPTLSQPEFKSGDFQTWRFRRKDDSVFAAEVLVAPMPDENLLAMVRDITPRQELEARLLQSQKMESIGQLAGGIAHDFNNILVPIMGYIELTMMQLEPGHKLQKNLERVREAAERAAGLTQQILAFSRKQVLEMKPLDLNEVVTGFSAMIQRLIGEDIEFHSVQAPDLHSVNADKGQLDQILLNLVVNAREAMPNGGSLTIETANAFLDAEHEKQHGEDQPPGQYVMLAVSDTGSGMDAETRSHIFEPFYTTKPLGESTGLGLATVFGIVKQHGGIIWVYSEPGRGTTFKIFLPRAEGGIQPPDVIEEEPASLQGTDTILVVEDDETVRQIVCEVLRAHGYDIIEAHSPIEGLQIAATKNNIDLLLTDVIMPAMNGRELYEKAAAIQPDIKVLYMSGYTDDVIVHHGILEEGVYFIQKPFTVKSLVQKVKRILS